MVEEAYSFSGFAEISAYTAEVSGLPIFEVGYERDALGRIVVKNEVVDGLATEYEYSYDPAGRLSRVEEDGVLVSEYSYDPNGNRLEHWASGTTTAGAYDDQDRLLSYGTTTYTYGANGELATATTGSDTTTYSYDARGNLRSVTLPDSTEIEYLVDGRSRRVGRKVDGVLERRWVYQDQLNPVAELDGSGAVVAEYIYATKPNVPDVMVTYSGGSTVATYRIISDHLGSVRLVIDATTGAITQRLDYDEFGQVLADTNPGFQPFAFAGGLYDPATGLVRFGARYYDARTGRWTAKDPIGFAGLDANLYLYAFNDAVNLVDPTGEISAPGVVGGLILLYELTRWGCIARDAGREAEQLADATDEWADRPGDCDEAAFEAERARREAIRNLMRRLPDVARNAPGTLHQGPPTGHRAISPRCPIQPIDR